MQDAIIDKYIHGDKKTRLAAGFLNNCMGS